MIRHEVCQTKKRELKHQPAGLSPKSTSSESVMDSLNCPFSAVGGGGGASGSDCCEGLPGHWKLSASLALSSLAVGSSQTICSLWDGSVFKSRAASLVILQDREAGCISSTDTFDHQQLIIPSLLTASLPQSFQSASAPVASHPAAIGCVGARVDPPGSLPGQSD